MAQIASRGGGTPFGSGVVTVAELLSRYPMPRPVGPGSQTVISVAALLRREGRVTHDLDDVDAGTALIARVHRRRVTARRGAIAAGTLLAAGSVAGAAVVSGAVNAPATDQTPAATTAAAGSIADPAPSTVQAAAPLTTLSEEAHVSPLDAGTPAPNSWMKVAFPDTAHKPSSKAPVAGTGKATSGSTATGPTAGSTNPGSTTQGTTGGSTTPQSSGAATTTNTGSSPSVTTTQPTGDSVTGRLGGALTGLGSNTPLAPVTTVVGGAVTGLGEFLGAVVHGTAAK